jgi:hypothetical protein
MLDTTIHKMKTNKAKNQHNICWTPPYTRRRQTKQKTNTIYAGHHHAPDEDKQSKKPTQYMLDTTIHQMKTNKTKNQHNICWTPPCTR